MVTIFDYNKEYIDVADRFIKANPEFNYIRTHHTDIRHVECDIYIYWLHQEIALV